MRPSLSSARGQRLVAVAGVLSVLTAAVVIAVQADGSPATNVRLDDGAVWVSNGAEKSVGRLNLRINEIDSDLVAGDDPDVIQETVLNADARPLRTVLFNPAGGVQRVDPAAGPLGASEVPFKHYHVGGGVSAVLDDYGRLWVGPSQQIVASNYPKGADALVQPSSRLVVTQAAVNRDGTITEHGKVLIVDDSGWYEVPLSNTLKPQWPDDGEGSSSSTTQVAPPTTLGESEPDPDPFEPEVVHPLGVRVADIVAFTSVGERPVVLTNDGRVVLADGTVGETIPGDQFTLQQPGPARATVLVGSDEGLFEIDLDSGEAATIVTASGAPSEPVMVGGCAFGAWSDTPSTWFNTCRDQMDEPQEVVGASAAVGLVFRVNQNNVALNSPGDGGVWAIHDGSLTHVAWPGAEPRTEQDNDDQIGEQDSTEVICEEQDSAPVANDDDVGVRPRQTVFDVLHNDGDPNCEPIAVQLIPDTAPAVAGDEHFSDGLSGEWGTITVIDNGQHLLYTPSSDWAHDRETSPGEFSFRYTVTDISGHDDSQGADVTVRVAGRNVQDSKPALRPKSDEPDDVDEMSAVVEEGRSISVNVMPNWWDPDGDDIQVVRAIPRDGGEATATPDGQIRFNAAGVPPGIREVEIHVTDGRYVSTAVLEVQVLPAGTPLPPIALDDFISVAEGATVSVSPLNNDSDPNEEPLTLRPEQSEELTVAVHGDTVRITGTSPGVYGLTYGASDGTDVTSATIRVEVVGDSEGNDAPIAVPDQVKVRPNRVVNIDVLDNDIDTDGDILAVVETNVASAGETGGVVRVSIVDRRMVQLEVVPGPDGAEPEGAFDVTYRVSDGHENERVVAVDEDEAVRATAASYGTIRVLVQPPDQDQPPVAVHDTVVVRTGDVASVAVLRNDLDGDGDPITLTGVDETAADDYEANAGGLIWVDGREVRVQGGTPGRYEVAYDIEAAGKSTSGVLTVFVTNVPSDDEPNNPPTPDDLEVRAIRNGTVRIKVPAFGIDQDGDSVVLLDELSTPRGRGNRVALDPENPGVILFTAGARSGATDSFDYIVQDRYGARGVATAYVTIFGDGGWSPQAHDDVFVGKPGRTMLIPVLANDTSPHDRTLEIARLPYVDRAGQPSSQPANGDAVAVLDQENPDTRGYFSVVVPDEGETLVERYRISDGLNPSDADIRVTSDPNAPNMEPVARDDNVGLDEIRGRDEVRVDVLVNDFDPDDAAATLELSVPESQSGTVEDGRLVVPITESSQIVLYRIHDADGGAAIGMLRVPGRENHPPTLSDVGRDAELREVEEGSTAPITIWIDEITEDPDGDTPIVLTDTELVQPSVGSVERLDGGDREGFRYTPPAERADGIVTIGFEVTDRPNLNASQRAEAGCNCVATLQVSVVLKGSSPPYVVGTGAVEVPVFGESVEYDLAPLTRDDQNNVLTYVPDEKSYGGLRVTRDGSTLTLINNDRTKLEADDEGGEPELYVGKKIRIRYTVDDGNSVDENGVPIVVGNEIVVTLISSNRPMPAATPLTPLVAKVGERIATPNLIANAFNPFAAEGEPLTFLGASVTGDAGLACSPTNSGVCDFVSRDAGTYTVTYTFGDAAQRTATGTLEVVVQGPPLQPSPPQIESTGDRTVSLTWTAPDMQGGEFVAYEVTATEQPSGPITTIEVEGTSVVFEGLDNDTEYRFSVVAVNSVGKSESSSPSSAATPDRVPDPPEALAIPDYGDQTLTLVWSQPSSSAEYSTIDQYRVTVGGQEHLVDGGVTQLDVGGLTNGVDYSFTVEARNARGWGQPAQSVGTERPSRQPDPPTNVVGRNSGDGGSPRVTVRWDSPASDGGRPIVEYEVCRNEDGVCRSTDGSTRQATFDVGAAEKATFYVVAFNENASRPHSERSASSPSVVGIAEPKAPTIQSVESRDRELIATATPGDNGGCDAVTIQYSIEGGAPGTWRSDGIFAGLENGVSRSVVARTVHQSSCYASFEQPPDVPYFSQSSTALDGTPFGPLAKPTVWAVRSGSGTVITWYWDLAEAANRASGREWTARTSGHCGDRDAKASSNSGPINFGWGPDTYTCTVTITAVGVAPVPDSASEETLARPSPDVHGDLGSPYTGDACPNATNCRHVDLWGENFTPNSTVSALCSGGGGTWWPIATTDSAGSFSRSQSPCFLDPNLPGDHTYIVQDSTGREGSITFHQ